MDEFSIHPMLQTLLRAYMGAYLVFRRGMANYIAHQDRKQFFYSINTSGIRAICGFIVHGLSSKFGLLDPLASYRVYNVKYAKLMGSRGLFKVRVELLDEN